MVQSKGEEKGSGCDLKGVVSGGVPVQLLQNQVFQFLLIFIPKHSEMTLRPPGTWINSRAEARLVELSRW